MNNKKLIIILIILFILALSLFGYMKLNNNKENKTSDKIEDSNLNNEGETYMNDFTTKINININGNDYTAILEDNETTRELVKLLPLDITMNELNGNEKYYYLDSSLPSNSVRVSKINEGDLMLYGSDCLVLFYESFNTSYSYTRLGKIDNPSSIKNDVGNKNIKVTISK